MVIPKLFERYHHFIGPDDELVDIGVHLAGSRIIIELTTKLDAAPSTYQISLTKRQAQNLSSMLHERSIQARISDMEALRRIRAEGLPDPQKIAAKIIRAAAVYSGIPIELVTGKRRSRRVIVARMSAIYVIRQSTDLSYPEIGRIFNRDHTTVMHSVKRVETNPSEEMVKCVKHLEDFSESFVKNIPNGVDS